MSVLSRMLWVVATTIILAASASANEARTRAAIDAASAWLALLDAGKSAEAYAAAGADFRSTVSAEAWTDVVKSRAAELGEVQARQPAKVNYFPAPEGAEAGDWVMIKFVSAFANRGQVSETVTVVRYPEAWGVSGYYIR